MPKFLKIALIVVVIGILAIGYLYLTGKVKIKNNKDNIATEDIFCRKNYTTDIFKINDIDVVKRIVEIWEEKEEEGDKCEFNIAGDNIGVAKKVSNDKRMYHIVLYDKDDKEQSKNPFDQSVEQFQINLNNNTISYQLQLDGSFFEIGKFKEEKIHSTFRFANNTALSLDDFKKISDFAETNDISKNPNRDFFIISGLEVETYGNYKPFDIISIKGILNGNYRKYVITEDLGSLSFGAVRDNNYEDMSDDDILNAREMVKLVLNGIDNNNLSEIGKWQTYKSDYGFEFKYPQNHTPIRDEEADDIDLKLVIAGSGDRNIKIASSPNDPNPSGKFFQTEMAYMRIKNIKGIYGPENWLSTRKNEYFPDGRDIKSQTKIEIDGKVAVELMSTGGLGALYRVVVAQGKENLIVITQDFQLDMFDQILSTFKFTE